MSQNLLSSLAFKRALKLTNASARPLASRSVLTKANPILKKPVKLVSRKYTTQQSSIFAPLDTFVRRHVGSGDDGELTTMLETLNFKSLDDLVGAVVPKDIQLNRALNLPGATSVLRGENELLAELKGIMSKNKVFKNFLGMGYYGTITPPVILRNILENPAWYTPYTPYQSEVSQGRLESLLNFQTMIADLTGMDISGASLLDEATAAAEAMVMATRGTNRNTLFVSDLTHPQTIATIKTRADPLNIEIIVGDITKLPQADKAELEKLAGVVVSYPATDGRIIDLSSVSNAIHANGGMVIAASDLLALTVLEPPSTFGADIVIGSAQRFGVPMGYGGPHAAFLATKDSFKRTMPGRIIGVSKDARGKLAYRMALGTREQHIRREKATSNICTAQALLANMAAMYAVYHGPEGLRTIANTVHAKAATLQKALQEIGYAPANAGAFFDTIAINTASRGVAASAVIKAAQSLGANFRKLDDKTITLSIDETTTRADLELVLTAFANAAKIQPAELQKVIQNLETIGASVPKLSESSQFGRKSAILSHPIFNSHHSEHEMLRYLYRLQLKDIGLTFSMIPLGSCTMKLNATSEMIPVTWPEIGGLHPFVPSEQSEGMRQMFKELEAALAEITGFHAVSLQPNAGSQGEYAGLLAIRAYHLSRGDKQRNICLIPVSAHGTNPASAVMVGMKVQTVKCDVNGNVDVADLKAKAELHKNDLAAFMITYPSTHGVFESSIKEIISTIHANGGQVYLDGANMNAQVGLCRPGDMGADVCHLNLHKTFCIPHGGGGPGMGPIGVAKHLAPFLPGHSEVNNGVDPKTAIGAVSAAPWGSSAILPIPYVFIKLMGPAGLRKATSVAILNANYMSKRLSPHYKTLYSGPGGLVGHEFILDLRPFKAHGIEAEDVAKRLMDYSFHAPTLSFPVAGTLMIEPTESESKAELDRFCDAMIQIRREIQDVIDGKQPKESNLLTNAPHTQDTLLANEWTLPYTREDAAYPLPYLRVAKFWPTVARVDNTYGDKNLICSCPPMEDY